MSPTFLEAVVVIILMVVAWQLGIIVTPNLLRLLKRMSQQIGNPDQDDDVQKPSSPGKPSSTKE